MSNLTLCTYFHIAGLLVWISLVRQESLLYVVFATEFMVLWLSTCTVLLSSKLQTVSRMYERHSQTVTYMCMSSGRLHSPVVVYVSRMTWNVSM